MRNQCSRWQEFCFALAIILNTADKSSNQKSYSALIHRGLYVLMKAQSMSMQWKMTYIIFADKVELHYNEQSGSVKFVC